MDVAVGSENPVKRSAVERVFDSATVGTRAVDSGVSEQPVGHAETIAGARTRARESFGTDVAYSVGLEGGVAEFSTAAERLANGVGDEEFDGAEGLFLIMWAAVADGKRIEIGAGPSVRLPDSIAREVISGAELGPLLDERLGTDDRVEPSLDDENAWSTPIAQGQGAIGVFTQGRITREDALANAVACAAGHLLNG